MSEPHPRDAAIDDLIANTLAAPAPITPDHQAAFEDSMWHQLEESVRQGWYTPEEAEECFEEYRERFRD